MQKYKNYPIILHRGNNVCLIHGNYVYYTSINAKEFPD